MENLNSLNKVKLVELVELKNKEISTLAAERQTAINIANYFGAVLENIETILKDSPLVEKKFFKKIWWIINNHKVLIDLIESILQSIKAWREEVNKINEALSKQQNVESK